MQNLYPSTVFLLALGAVAGSVSAQTAEVAIPSISADTDAQQSLAYPFGHDGFRFQQVIDGTAVAPTFALIQEIAFRADRLTAPLNAHTIPNVSIWMGTTSATPQSMSTSFATNRASGTQTLVFQGTVNLPAQPAIETGVLPWNIVIPLATPFPFTTGTGNLLLEIEAANAPFTPNFYELDAAEPGGTVLPFGERGPVASGDTINLIGHHGVDLRPAQIVPGGSIQISTTTFFSQYAGALMIGFSNSNIGGAPLPLDLGVIGAPGNKLYQDVALSIPLTNWNGTFIGNETTTILSLPNDPSLEGIAFYAQSGVIDIPSNALGLVTSEALEVVVGGNVVFPLQALVSPDPTATTGSLATVFGDPTRPVGTALRFTGLIQ